MREPGRRIVEAELARGGTALPWIDLEGFLRKAIAMALDDWKIAFGNTGVTFFDRSLIDAAVALESLTGQPATAALHARNRYHHRVFMAPPWPEIFVADSARRHGFDDAVGEFDQLMAAYPALGYDVVILPKTSVSKRAELILSQINVTSDPAS